MGLPRLDADLGDLDLGLGDPTPCINRARLNHPCRTYADIKALMSLSDRVVDLRLPRAEISAMTPKQLSDARNAPPVGRGDETALLAIYPVSKDSRPDRGTERVKLDALRHVVGVGLVFPRSKSEEDSAVEYRTVDLSSIEREQPEAEDEPRDDEALEA
jgi:hypothetical protein